MVHCILLGKPSLKKAEELQTLSVTALDNAQCFIINVFKRVKKYFNKLRIGGDLATCVSIFKHSKKMIKYNPKVK